MSKSWTIKEDEILVLFDVVSLFTNVLTDLGIHVAKRKPETDDELK